MKLLDISSRQYNVPPKTMGSTYTINALKHHKHFVQMRNDAIKIINENERISKRIIEKYATAFSEEAPARAF